MIIEQYRQFLVILYVKPTLLGAEVMVAVLVAPSFENDAKINLLPVWCQILTYLGILNFCTITIAFCYQISTYLYNKKCPKIQVSEQVF